MAPAEFHAPQAMTSLRAEVARIMEAHRATVLRVSCSSCGVVTVTSNRSDDQCDTCYRPVIVIGRTTHEPPWQRRQL